MVKFLVIRFSSIGDIVLTTPLLRCLKQQVEGAEVHFLVKPAFSEILAANPYVSKIHILSNIQNETVASLKREEFDYVLDLQNNVRSGNIKRSLKKMYFTVDKLNLKKWLLVNLKIDRLPDLHIVDRYMNTGKLFDLKNDNSGLDYFIKREDEVDVSSFPPIFQTSYIAMVIGAMHITKKMPVPKLIELASMLEYPIILIGGKEDRPAGEEIVKALAQKNILNACGQYSINTSASIIKNSRSVLTHDTGMMHIAAAFKKRIVTIWGNTIPKFGMSPYQSNPASVNMEVLGLKCRPCSKLGKKSCPKKHFKCMMDQDISMIASYVNN